MYCFWGNWCSLFSNAQKQEEKILDDLKKDGCLPISKEQYDYQIQNLNGSCGPSPGNNEPTPEEPGFFDQMWKEAKKEALNKVKEAIKEAIKKTPEVIYNGVNGVIEKVKAKKAIKVIKKNTSS